MCGSSDAAQATVSEDVLGQLFNETVNSFSASQNRSRIEGHTDGRPQNAGTYCAVSNELHCLKGCVEKKKKNSTVMDREQFFVLWLERDRSHDQWLM